MTLMSAEVVVLADITQPTLYEIPLNVLIALSILKKKKKAQTPPQKKTTKKTNQNLKNNNKKTHTHILLVSPVCH